MIENCECCPLEIGDGADCKRSRYDDEKQEVVPGSQCPFVLLAAKDAEIKRLEQYGIDTHREYETMTAERNSYYAETENLRESLAAKERECAELRKQLTYEKADHAVTMEVLDDLQSFLPEDSALRSDEIYKSQFEGGER